LKNAGCLDDFVGLNKSRHPYSDSALSCLITLVLLVFIEGWQLVLLHALLSHQCW